MVLGFLHCTTMSAPVNENSPYRVILDRILSSNHGLLADEGLIQALLLVLVAKQKHLIVQTPDTDVAKVLKQVVVVIATCRICYVIWFLIFKFN